MSAALTKNQNRDMEVVIAELERNLVVLEANYQKAVSNLNLLRQCVEKDDLTRLLRRGAFMAKFRNLLSSSQENGREVCVMMIDVDYFKRVNDSYGHQSGDVVLERVSQLVQSYLRPQDLAGRYGGEEIIVAIEASSREAMQIAENIRAAVENHRMRSAADAEVEFTVTLSVGVASTQQFKFEADRLIQEADTALYRAKNSGRNRVIRARAQVPLALVVQEAA